MSEIKRKAAAARALRNDESFQDVLSDIKSNAISCFCNPKSSIDDIADAHLSIKAIGLIEEVLLRRENNERFELEKEGKKHGSS